MSEKTLWNWLKGKVQPHWHILRVESNTLLGIPDVNYCSATGMEGWVELKCADRFPPSGKPTFALASQHNLSPQQARFLKERSKRGSCSGILAQIGAERFFIPAKFADEFNELTEAQFREYDILAQWLDADNHG